MIWRCGALALLLSLSAPIVAAQDLWYKAYEDGIAAFDKGDFALAEQKMLASIKTGPKAHSLNVIRYSQVRGFVPEYYLVLIYTQLKKYDEARKYIVEAKRSLNPNNYTSQRDLQRLPRETATYIAALNGAEVEMSRTAGGSGIVEPPPPAPARGGGAGGVETGDRGAPPPKQPTLADFNGAYQQSADALRDKRFADARTGARTARDMNVDNARADRLLADITAGETFDREVAAANRAFGDRQFGEARSAATRARATNVDNTSVDALLRRIDVQQYSDGLNAVLKKKPLDQTTTRSLRDKLAAVDAGNAMITAADDAMKGARLELVTSQMSAALNARAVDRVGRLLPDLRAADPANALIPLADGLIRDSASAEQRVRLGVASFYRGDYQASADTLAALVSPDRPKASFYLAASRAALSLVAADDARRSMLRQQALDAIAGVRAETALFAEDLKFVSPKVVELLGLAVR